MDWLSGLQELIDSQDDAERQRIAALNKQRDDAIAWAEERANELLVEVLSMLRLATPDEVAGNYWEAPDGSIAIFVPRGPQTLVAPNEALVQVADTSVRGSERSVRISIGNAARSDEITVFYSGDTVYPESAKRVLNVIMALSGDVPKSEDGKDHQRGRRDR